MAWNITGMVGWPGEEPECEPYYELIWENDLAPDAFAMANAACLEFTVLFIDEDNTAPIGGYVWSYTVDPVTLAQTSTPTKGSALPNTVGAVASPWVGSPETVMNSASWAGDDEMLVSGYQQKTVAGFIERQGALWSVDASGSPSLIFDGNPSGTSDISEVHIATRHAGSLYGWVEKVSVGAEFVAIPSMSTQTNADATIGRPGSMVSDGTYIWCTKESGSLDLHRWDPSTDTVTTYTNPLGEGAGFLASLAYETDDQDLLINWSNAAETVGQLYTTNVSTGTPTGTTFVLVSPGRAWNTNWVAGADLMFFANMVGTGSHYAVEPC